MADQQKQFTHLIIGSIARRSIGCFNIKLTASNPSRLQHYFPESASRRMNHSYIRSIKNPASMIPGTDTPFIITLGFEARIERTNSFKS